MIEFSVLVNMHEVWVFSQGKSIRPNVIAVWITDNLIIQITNSFLFRKN